jgi:hypothetical protein
MSEASLLQYRFGRSVKKEYAGLKTCSLFVDKVKQSRAVGEGNLMGQALAGWLEKAFQNRLLDLFAHDIRLLQEQRFTTARTGIGYRTRKTERYPLVYVTEEYNERNNVHKIPPTIKVHLDAMRSYADVERLAVELGMTFKWIDNTRHNDPDQTFYLVTINSTTNGNPRKQKENHHVR